MRTPTGGDADWVADINTLKALGVSAVDLRLFGRTRDEKVEQTLDNMRRFRDGVLAKL